MQPTDSWSSGGAYDSYVGRWSRLVAAQFLTWLGRPAGSRWLDVGCGTGALSRAILQTQSPAHVKGIDRSADYIAYARAHVEDERLEFETGDAQALPVPSGGYDAAVSALMLNFVPQPGLAAAEMRRALRAGGMAAAYVWDYAEGARFLRHFWDAAAALDPSAIALDEGRRFPLCQAGPLQTLFEVAGLHAVEGRSIEIVTAFRDFDDYWSPFLSRQGPAPSYVMSLNEEQRRRLRERLRAALAMRADGSISLTARAWAVRGLA